MHLTKIPHQVRDDEKVMWDDEKSGAGVPYIVALKKNCTVDPDSTDGNNHPMSCINGIYDYNGTRLPNEDGEDITSINGARISTRCITKIGGVCIVTKAIPSENTKPITYPECESKYLGKLTNSCYLDGGTKRDDDYWLGAKVACNELGLKLPTQAQLGAISNELFKNGTSRAAVNAAAEKLGSPKINDPPSYPYHFILWADTLYNSEYAWDWYYGSTENRINYNERHHKQSFICVPK